MTPPKKSLAPLFLLAGALGAGFLNGLLGTGGGALLFFVLGALYSDAAKENLILTTASVMIFCLVSLFFYGGDLPLGEIMPIALPAAVGGTVGALILKKLPQSVAKKLFSVILIVGGILMLTR